MTCAQHRRKRNSGHFAPAKARTIRGPLAKPSRRAIDCRSGGRIEIDAEIIDGQLAVHVLDTGIGFMPKAEAGVGLANVRARLKALYNGRAELIIKPGPNS